jgi:hypothetical protein
MVPLTLFSELVPTAERRALADKLLTVKPVTAPLKPARRYGTGFCEPFFPSEVTDSTTLADLVGLDSWYTMHVCIGVRDIFLWGG